jgi:hypothetical protein
MDASKMKTILGKNVTKTAIFSIVIKPMDASKQITIYYTLILNCILFLKVINYAIIRLMKPMMTYFLRNAFTHVRLNVNHYISGQNL